MKVILEFDSIDDAKTALVAREMYLALTDLDISCRNDIKHGNLSESENVRLEAIRSRISEALSIEV